MQYIKGHILAVVTISIWSSTFIVSKILLEQFSPLQILLVRFIMAICFLSILYPRFSKPKAVKEELLFLLVGFSLVGYFICENSALKHTYSSNVSLIVSTIPLITGLVSAIFFKTPFFNKQSILGFAICYSGVALIIISGNKIVGIEPIGDFFALLASILFAVYSLAMQRIDKSYHLIDMTRKVFFYGSILLLTLNLIVWEPIQLSRINASVVISFLFLGIVAASLAFLMWNKAIHLIGSVKTNQYIYLVPVITTILSAIVIHERITPYTIIGAMLIIGGLYLSERNQKNEALEVKELDV